MIPNDNNLPMLFNSWDEVNFLLEALQPHHTVLEYGAGGSTIEIAKRVNWLYSIEHDKRWLDRVDQEIKLERLSNICLVHVPKNKEEAPGHDGTLEDYRDYVEYPRKFDKVRFDVVLVDGRARVPAARVAADLLAPDGIIFIHDYKNPNPIYRRHDYEVVETFLEEIGGVYALYKFRKRQ
jgi:SAM-dependent methyltransferase